MTEHLPEEPTPSNIPELPPEPGGPVRASRTARFLERAFQVIIGPARRITDPHLFHKISLAAFLAWVGLGADGLSSSAYGPEAAFHALGAIGAAILLNIHQVPLEVTHLREQSSLAVQSTGWIPLLMILFRAFTLGGGTYTGIEAVSNGVPMLREPKVETAKITMRYMAFSLAFIAGGILVGYLLYQVHAVPGKTLNAVLWYAVAGQMFPPGSQLGSILVAVLLLSAGALLFVAAQTGFLGGPRVLVYMALDRWVPSRFANLSERLVSSNGVLFMAAAAAAVLALTRGAVHVLVVL